MSSFSVTKNVSLVLGQKAYFACVGNSVPSMLIPLPSVNILLKSAIYKSFLDLKNNCILAFNQRSAFKDLNIINRQHKTQLITQELHFSHQTTFDSIERVQVKPLNVFLAADKLHHSLPSMLYKGLQEKMLYMKSDHKEGTKKDEKPKHQSRQGESQVNRPTKQDKKNEHENKKDEDKIKQPKKAKQIKGKSYSNKDGTSKQVFKDQEQFQQQQVSTWNGEAPQTATLPQDQPKEDASFLHQHPTGQKQNKN